MKHARALAVALLAASGAPLGCDFAAMNEMVAAPPNDAGDEAFIRSALPVLLGRHPLGSNEIYALREILRVEGGDRQKFVSVLLKSPEVAEYWTSVLVDGLRPDVGWEDYLKDGPSNVPPTEKCFLDEKLTTDTDRKAAAAHVQSSLTSAQFEKSFTYRDLVRGAILNDDLSPIVPAWLILLNSARTVNYKTGPTAVWNASRVTETVLDRDYECLGCHSSASSSTDGEGAADRFFPHVLPTTGGVVGPGAASDLVAEIDTEAPLFGPCAVEGACKDHQADLANFFVADAPGLAPGVIPTSTAWNLWCSQAPAASPEAAPVSFAGVSAAGGKSTADLIATFRSGVSSLAAGSSETTGPNAFAFLAASNLVNRIFSEVSGHPLTLVHGFSRTSPQRAVLDELIASFVGRRSVPGNWSLKNVLSSIVLSPLFNRNAPPSVPGPDAYRLPMITNPWALDGDVPASTTTGANKNGQGDLVGRRSAFALLYSASKAYGTTASWPSRPTEYKTGALTYDYAHDLGAHLNYLEPGHRAVAFDMLAAWNARPAPSAGTFWPAMLAYLEARWVIVSGGKRNQMTYSDLVIAMKNRMLAEPSLTAAEKQDIAAYFGVASADGYILESTWKTGNPTGIVRAERLFTVLAETPDFMLTGLPPAVSLPASWTSPVKMKICPGGESCSIPSWMSRYKLNTKWAGVTATCSGKCGQTVTQGTYTCSCADSCATTSNCCYDKVDMCPFGSGGGGGGGSGGAPVY